MGGTATNGILNLTGGTGGGGGLFSINNALYPKGGDTPLGYGRGGSAINTAAGAVGVAGSGFGSGGSGGCNGTAATARAGSVGIIGVIIVEY